MLRVLDLHITVNMAILDFPRRKYYGTPLMSCSQFVYRFPTTVRNTVAVWKNMFNLDFELPEMQS